MGNVSVTYEEMQQAAKRLTDGKEEITQKLSALQKLVNSLVNGGFVTDQSSKQFEQSYNEFNTGATKMMDGLQGMGTYLTKAAEAFKQADDQLARELRK